MSAEQPRVSLYEFMPYGAPELLEVAKQYMFRAVATATGAMTILFLLLLGTNWYLSTRPKPELNVPLVPFRELAAPPPLSENTPPPQVAITQPVAPPTAAVPVPVPDAQAPEEQTIASQEEISASTPGVAEGSGDQIQVQAPTDEGDGKLGEYVYTDELPELITRIQPVYPDLAREAGVDGTVQIQALIGKDGRVKDLKVVKSIPMLDKAAMDAVKQFVFKPALANNHPVAVSVMVPVRFSLH